MGIRSAIAALGALAVVSLAAVPPASAQQVPAPGGSGAVLPISYSLAELPGRAVYLATTGSDTTGDGSLARPFKTLPKAVAVAAPGDSVVVRGGVYPVPANRATIAKPLTVIAYPGELPVFDGSRAAPLTTTANGTLRSFSYQPLPARPGDGMSITQLPVATFSGGRPTGLAAERGWRCVQNSSVAVDAAQQVPYTAPSGTGTGCPSGTTPRVITGYYPDQVWVGARALTQVHDRSRVVRGTFFVAREHSTDAAPAATTIFLDQADAADMRQVRVSDSRGTFLNVTASGVRLEGITLRRHSPAWTDFGIRVGAATSDVVLRDIAIQDNASIAVKIAGGATAEGLARRVLLERVTIERAGWLGVSVVNADDPVLSRVLVRGTNPHAEFNASPKSGAIKISRTHRFLLEHSVLEDGNGHGLWIDQSSYRAVVAGNRIAGNSDSGVFFEISHGLTMVNNLVLFRPSNANSPAVRLAGSSGIDLVNNTVVGSQIPVAFAGDPRSRSYGDQSRLCAEHTFRYTGTGNPTADCSALASDYDRARLGAYAAENLTPGLTWLPVADRFLNNVFAHAAPQVGPQGICPGGYLVCVKGFAGSATSPVAQFETNVMLPPTLVMDGNVYEGAARLFQVRPAPGRSGGFTADTLDAVRGPAGLGSPWYGLDVEQRGLAGVGWVGADGSPTQALRDRQGQAAPVPADPVINRYVPAGSANYGAAL